MSPLAYRIALGYLAFSGLLVGAWAQFAPRSFYDDFPGGGRDQWVGVDGPYNEHLVRDVGGLYLGMALLAVWAAVALARTLVRVAGAAWLTFSLPHLVYHLANLEPLSTTDAVLESVSLGLLVLVALALAAAPPPPRDPAPR